MSPEDVMHYHVPGTPRVAANIPWSALELRICTKDELVVAGTGEVEGSGTSWEGDIIRSGEIQTSIVAAHV